MFGIENSANNFGRSAGLLANTFAQRPITAALGTLFIASDTLIVYRWNGTAWDTIGGGGGVFGGVTNGLQILGGAVGLGGSLTQNTDINCFNYAFKFEVFNSFAIGDGTEPTLILNSSAQTITTSFSGSENGLKFNFSNKQYLLGDFNYDFNGTHLFIADTAQKILTVNNNNYRGLNLDFGNLQYWLGDYSSTTNGYWLMIDDNNGELYFNGVNLESSNSSGNSGQHLVIVLNGNQYKIKLENP